MQWQKTTRARRDNTNINTTLGRRRKRKSLSDRWSENAEWKPDYLLRCRGAQWRRPTRLWLRRRMMKVTPTNHRRRRARRNAEVAGEKWMRHLELWHPRISAFQSRSLYKPAWKGVGNHSLSSLEKKKPSQSTGCSHTVPKSLPELFNPAGAIRWNLQNSFSKSMQWTKTLSNFNLLTLPAARKESILYLFFYIIVCVIALLSRFASSPYVPGGKEPTHREEKLEVFILESPALTNLFFFCWAALIRFWTWKNHSVKINFTIVCLGSGPLTHGRPLRELTRPSPSLPFSPTSTVAVAYYKHVTTKE